MRQILLILLILPNFLISQVNQLFSESDTIKYEHRTGGKGLDSLDMTFCNSVSTFSGGVLNNQNKSISSSFLFSHPGLQGFKNNTLFKPLVFSGTPHLGFSYSFGAKGIQFLHYDFQQAISKNILLNIEGLRNSSGIKNGTASFLRNSKYSDNIVSVSLRKNGVFHSMLFESNYINKTISLNGGITSDEFIDSQGTESLPVLKKDAKQIIKSANIKLTNCFNVLNDSMKSLGFISKNQYEITSREYTETDILSVFNINQFKTRDQYRLASVRNSLGVYTKTKTLFLDVLLQHRYWDYQNLGNHIDTTEVNLTSALEIKFRGSKIKNNFYFNLIGAGREWSNSSNLLVTLSKVKLIGTLCVERKWPDQFQRFYYSNKYDYKLINYQLQNRFYSEVTGRYDFSNSFNVQVSLSNTLLNNNYFFINNTWRNDTLNTIIINSLLLSGSLKFGILTIQPRLCINIPTSNFNYIPKTTINSRIFIKKKIFKAKKFECILGTDFSWVSSYNLMAYNYTIDVFSIENTSKQFVQMTNLSAFFGFTLGDFRMYARMENIGYFWNDKRNQIVEGFPIQKNFIRLGVTWDFFN